MGSCRCSAGTLACGGTCADITSDPHNCGACGVSCGAGRACAGARCVCESGKTACASGCVDVSSDSAHCGQCSAACILGQACEGARCTGGGASGPDGCRGLALGVTLDEVAVYQTVSVPVMRSGVEIAAGARNTDVVVGRGAVFRLFVSVDAKVARQLSARVLVQSGARSNVYFSRANLAGTSDEGVLASTFQVTVPKDEISADARYAVEVVECGAPAPGVARRSRYPASADAALGARETGGLKIRLIPLVANSYVPDTSETALSRYRALMMAMYPITSLAFSVGAALTAKDPTDFNGMLDQVRTRRELDRPAADVYYYGLFQPTATLHDYCASGCTAGVGFVPAGTPSQQASQRVALGLAFGDDASAETMAHEVGHNHGRDHAPCPQWGINGVDLKYPYASAATGVYGWDSRFESLVPPTATDIMGYCNNKWISDYTYDALLNRVASLQTASASEINIADEEPLLVLLVDSRGARWGEPRPRPALPVGVPEPAVVIDALGRSTTALTVYRTRVSDVNAHSIQVPSRLASSGARLRLRDGTEIEFQ